MDSGGFRTDVLRLSRIFVAIVSCLLVFFRDESAVASKMMLGSGRIGCMSKAEILAELPRLSPEELAEVQAKLDELAGEVWLDRGELTDGDKAALEASLADYRNDPDAGSTWEAARARIQARLRA
jgi:putative addiction module component (TIGR02574 family)